MTSSRPPFEPPLGLTNTDLVALLDSLPPDMTVRLYHGTIRAAAERIVTELRLIPDDLDSVGLTSDSRVAIAYGGYKDWAQAVVVEVLVARPELGVSDIGNLAAQRFLSEENGGAGYDSVLVYELPARGKPRWPGVNLIAARILARH